ncbi:MAG: MutH/Sau3AI family endonuclease [Duncaniella sp.]|nr:MutH/Sau3AI family endonuclease [Duncaniella sp.]
MSNYNPASKEDILRHALIMLGRSLRLEHPEKTIESRKGKGGMGQAMEEIHFEYTPNSNPTPDFDEAGVELKCTPLKELKDGSLVPKERLVLNIINYITEARQEFKTSSFWHKNACLLLMFYLHEQGVDVYDLLFKVVRLWEYPPEDLKIIEDDWKTIHNKILAGKAHELSEGDTFYLGAVTKGSKAGAEMRQQPFSDIPAPQRAYSLKSAYLGSILLDTMTRPEFMSGMKMTDKQRKNLLKRKAELESAVKSLKDYKEGESFEQLIERRFSSFYGMSINEISQRLGVEITLNPKAVGPRTCRAILGVKAAKVAEFEKANIQMKTIRLQSSGALKESMVFDTISYLNLVSETTWEDSVLYQTLTQRFLFVVFTKAKNKKSQNGKIVKGEEGDAVLTKVFFWTMPHEDLEIARMVWQDTKAKVEAGVYDSFIKISNDMICHVRPKAKDSSDLTPTPQGFMGPKRAFWLNREYIHNLVLTNLEDSE